MGDWKGDLEAEGGEPGDRGRLGLVVCDPRWINVTPRGRFLIRNVCMVFDKYLRHDQEVKRYSRVI